MIDLGIARFAMQSIISLTIAGFCIGMLARGDETQIYLPVLTGIAGYWLPQPSMKRSSPSAPSQNDIMKIASDIEQRSNVV